MRKMIFGILLLVAACNTFATLGRFDIYFIKGATISDGSTIDICLVDANWTNGSGHYLIKVDGSAMSDYMINIFTKWQNTGTTMNLVCETISAVSYTGGTRSNPLYPPANTYVLLTALDFIDNQ